MKWHFQPRPGGDEAEPDDDDAVMPRLLGIPAALLERHDARILHPGRAAVVYGYPAPRPTVYRARTLVISGDLLWDHGRRLTPHNDVLAQVGMALKMPEEGHDHDLDTDRGDRRVFDILRGLPRPVALVPVQGHPVPVDVDAWTALQTLRAATVPDSTVSEDEDTGTAPTGPKRVRLDRSDLYGIELEHLLIGSAITGSPIGGSHGGISGSTGSGSDTSGPSDTDSYLFSGGDPRTPVTVFFDPPSRLSAGDCESLWGRRPVVAVMDSGVAEQSCLDVDADGAGGYTMAPDGFVAWDDNIQSAIRAEGERAVADGDRSRRVIRNAWDQPISDNPLMGELNDALGHSTFISGVIRQVTSDARVMAIRVTGSDNILYEGDIICGLRHLAKRIALAEPDDLMAQVDVVSLSFGYFSESPHDQMVTSGLWRAIEVLLSLGVIVVAAAGNFASSQRFYPAAFALKAGRAGEVPVISVGALNPNGTKAMFSNDGRWVTAWAPGASVISTYPTDIDGSRTPELRIPRNREPSGQWPPGRESLDPDDYSSGFAVWSGTSFSAPYAAALIARSLIEGAERDESGLRLDALGTNEKKRRAMAAYDNLPREIP